MEGKPFDYAQGRIVAGILPKLVSPFVIIGGKSVVNKSNKIFGIGSK
jgi:hypothetical protein